MIALENMELNLAYFVNMHLFYMPCEWIIHKSSQIQLQRM